MRFAVTITGYKNLDNKIENFITQSIQEAETKESAIIKGVGTKAVSEHLIDGYKLFWKVAIEIPEPANLLK